MWHREQSKRKSAFSAPRTMMFEQLERRYLLASDSALMTLNVIGPPPETNIEAPPPSLISPAVPAAQLPTLLAFDKTLAFGEEKPIRDFLGGDALTGAAARFELQPVSVPAGLLQARIATRMSPLAPGTSIIFGLSSENGVGIDEVSLIAGTSDGMGSLRIRINEDAGTTLGEWANFRVTVEAGGPGPNPSELIDRIRELRLERREGVTTQRAIEIRDEIRALREQIALLPPDPILPVVSPAPLGPEIAVPNTNPTLYVGQTIPAANLFQAAIKDSAEYYTVEDLTADSSSGYFVHHGITVLAGSHEHIFDLSKLAFVAGTKQGVDTIRVSASASTKGPAREFDISTINRPSTPESPDFATLLNNYLAASEKAAPILSALDERLAINKTQYGSLLPGLSVNPIITDEPLRTDSEADIAFVRLQDSLNAISQDIKVDDLTVIAAKEAAKKFVTRAQELIQLTRSEVSNMARLLQSSSSEVAGKYLADWRFGDKAFWELAEKLTTCANRFLKLGLPVLGSVISIAEAWQERADALAASDPNANLKFTIDLVFTAGGEAPVVGLAVDLFVALGGDETVEDLIDSIARLKEYSQQ